MTDSTVELDDLWNINLDYSDRNSVASLFTPEGNIHNYPAKALPEMVRELLFRIKDSNKVRSVLDPFVGSGTVALESKILGLDFFGSDLNPLAVLLARTKSLTITNALHVKRDLEKFVTSLSDENMDKTLFNVEHFKNIDYWFKKENIRQLSYIKHRINLFLNTRSAFYKEIFALIMLTGFSSTVRGSSLSRNNEFKLYRIPRTEIIKFNVNSISIFSKSIKNILDMIQDTNKVFDNFTTTEIHLKNAKDLSYMKKRKIDLVLTSPPYGDSKSTVAYGQFSRLSVQWMSDLLKRYLKIRVFTDNCDEHLLGGKYSILTNCKESSRIPFQSSITLQNLIHDMENIVCSEKEELELAKENLNKLIEDVNKNNVDFDQELLLGDKILLSIFKERLRLYIYKKLNENTDYDKKSVKALVASRINGFWGNLTRRRNVKLLLTVLPSVRGTINSKLLHVPRRINEVLSFFMDLYTVVEQTDKVLANDGIQVWIVGHRTVLGKLKVQLSTVLLEWFKSLNYVEVKSMKRQCSFKRLPHHINSTVTRKEEIQTMMEEYIIVVQKQ